jgi:hypothetical protein
VPQALLLEMRERIRKKTKVTRDEGFKAEHHLRKTGEHQQREKNSKAHGREEFFGESGWAARLHAQIKTGGGAKCNVFSTAETACNRFSIR